MYLIFCLTLNVLIYCDKKVTVLLETIILIMVKRNFDFNLCAPKRNNKIKFFCKKHLSDSYIFSPSCWSHVTCISQRN